MPGKLPSPEEECFLITPIGEPGTEIRQRSDHVSRLIVEPGVELLGLKPVRGHEIHRPGEAIHQLVEHLVTARAAVADLTGGNPNVYYELAIRQAAGLP